MAERAHLCVMRARLDTKLCIPMTSAMRRRLEREAHAAGYRSLAGYVRDIKLSAPMSRREVLDCMTALADECGQYD